MAARMPGEATILLPAEEDRQHRHLRLPNGLEIILVSDPEADKAAAAMAVKVGFLQDPDHAQGIAHFLEHMLFLGTEKYPEETSYSAYLNAHGGSSNAYTDSEDTVYYFDVNSDHLGGALDIFAQFFIAPLFTEAATDREMHAVDSEHSKNLQQDSWRSNQLYKAMASPKHPFSRFGTGNLKTLRDDPKAAGVDTRSELLRFHERYYSSGVMRMAVVGRDGLDELQAMAERMFSKVVDKGVKPPLFEGPPPYGSAEVGKVIELVPVKEIRRIQLVFALPPLHPHYRQKPQRYLSHLLGDEGKGSLLSLLKARGLANDLWAGENLSTAGFATFAVAVECTDRGIASRDEVVAAVFGYMNLMREQPPQERIFNEMRDIAELNFRFSSKQRPMDYVQRLATNMHLFPPDLAVAGPSLLFDFDAKLIQETLERLRPANMILAVTHKGFEETADQREPWYGTKYSVKPLPSALLADWDACAPDPALKLPEPNPYIATDFSLRCEDEEKNAGGKNAAEETASTAKDNGLAAGENGKGKVAPEPPKLLRDDAGCRLWFKQDKKFRKPKLIVRYKLATKAVYEDPTAAVLSELFVSVLKELINEETYEASLANLHVSIGSARDAIDIDFAGYNHKLPVLIEKVFAIMAGCRGNAPSQELFDRMLDKHVKTLENQRFLQPYSHAMLGTSLCTLVHRWSYEDKLLALTKGNITPASLASFAEKALAGANAEILVHGNASAEEAAKAAALLDQAMRRKPLPPSEYPETRVVELPAGQKFLLRVPSPNPAETNSAVEITYPAGVESAGRCGRLEMVAHLARDRAFDTLRTKETLGYLVWTGTVSLNSWISGFRAVIMSSGHGPAYLESRVEAFLGSFREYLAALPEAELEDNKTALRESLLEKDKNLSEENERHWGEIRLRRYEFDWSQQLAAEVGTLTRAEVLRTFDEFVAPEASTRKKISSQVVSKEHEAGDLAVGEDVVTIDKPLAFRVAQKLYPPRPPGAVAKL